MSCCLLMALNDRLLTRSRLLKFGIINSDLCVLCNTNSKTVEHLFFSCEYSTYIWAQCKFKLGLQPNVHNLQKEANSFRTIYAQNKRSSALWKLVLAAAVWYLWKERNRRVFKAKEHTKLELIKKITADVNILMNTCSWKIEGTTKELEIFSNWNLSIDR